MIRPLLIRIVRGATVLVALGFLVVYVLHASGRLSLLAADEPKPPPTPEPSAPVLPSSKVIAPVFADAAVLSTSKSGAIRDTASAIFLRRMLAPDDGDTVMVSSKVSVIRPLPKPRASSSFAETIALDRPFNWNLLRLPALAPPTMGSSKSGAIRVPLPAGGAPAEP